MKLECNSEYFAQIFLKKQGYLPCDLEEREKVLLIQREMYHNLQNERKQQPHTESYRDFKNCLDRDLVRIITNNTILKMISSALKLFNYTKGVPYNSAGMSIHFPFIQVAYIQQVIEYYNLQHKSEYDYMTLLAMELPNKILRDIEADFFWCLSLSFDYLKVKIESKNH